MRGNEITNLGDHLNGLERIDFMLKVLFEKGFATL